MLIQIRFVCLISYIFSVSGDISCLTPACTCGIHTAICTGNNLTYVPRFPEKIREITIKNANLGNLEEKGFINLTFNYIVQLELNNNSIQHIHPHVFRSINNVIKLKILNEPALDIRIVKQALDYMNKTMLKNLGLSNNRWKDLPNDMFDSFKNTKIKYIHLPGNRFQNVNGSIFASLQTLQFLNLEQNEIEKVYTRGLNNIRDLNLANNKIEVIPKWCDSNTKSNENKLKVLHLNNNYITRLSRFNYLPRLSFLSLEGNAIGEIPEIAFSELTSLRELNLKAVGTPLRKIEVNAFNLSLLETLTLGNCFFHFDHLDPYALSNMFQSVPNLEILNIANNFFPLDEHSFNILFKPLTKLRKLHLDSCKLFALPVGVFSNFRHLEELTLNGNKLQSWGNGDDVFGNLSSIKKLDMSGNRINIINETSFPASLLSSLKTINLAYNPYYCTCDQMWFVDWLRDTKVTMQGYPEKYKCVQPANMAKTLLKDYRPTKKSCTPWNPLFTIIISTSSFGVFMIILILTIYKFQINIRNYIYLLRVYRHRKQGYLPIDGADDFEFHAFVVYCDADRIWVHNFVKKVEREEGLRLCIHHRDFEVGETISGNIDKFLKKSWKVVVVMSNNFAKSEWCQWEVDIVQERRRRQGRDVFLLIMLKNITSKYMTSPLRTLLDSTPHLTYQQGVGEEIFWKAAIESLRKPVGNPPISVF